MRATSKCPGSAQTPRGRTRLPEPRAGRLLERGRKSSRSATCPRSEAMIREAWEDAPVLA